jgi:UDP-N-acetylglucosamine--N-acetylmuramyl-(pentapeptide) pyrophosphoryl-undecaprenol N-acetylglucosamine transferase
LSIVITGGGTGGHLVIAKAIKEELNQRDIEPIFIGSTYGQDRAWFEDDDGWSEKYFFDTSGVVNKRGLKKLQSLYEISRKIIDVKEIFKTHNVKRVFSVGGYSAASASLGAIIYRKPLFIHEQNAVMGRLNRLLKPYAKKIYSNDPAYYPVREVFFKNARVRSDIKTIIFLGGSQGASAINEFAYNIAKDLNQRGVKIIHQCGERDLDKARKFYEKEGIAVDLFAFSKSLDLKIKDADFAICRSGASTIWELLSSGLPALYIPYPYAAGDHQYFNAKFLSDKNLSLLKREESISESLVDDIFNLDLKSMSQGLIDLSVKDGAKNIVDELLEGLKL